MEKPVSIFWTYPNTYNKIIATKPEIVYEIGIYQITSKYKNKQKLLYIGETNTTFLSRLTQHLSWIDDYKGTKYVRFGKLFLPKNANNFRVDIQNALIFETQPTQKIKATQTYQPLQDYNIFSYGNRGAIPALVQTVLH